MIARVPCWFEGGGGHSHGAVSKKSMLADAGDSLDHVQNTLRTPTSSQAGRQGCAGSGLHCPCAGERHVPF